MVDWLARNRLTEVSPEDIEAAQACRTVDLVLRAMHQVSAEEWSQIVAVTPTAA